MTQQPPHGPKHIANTNNSPFHRQQISNNTTESFVQFFVPSFAKSMLASSEIQRSAIQHDNNTSGFADDPTRGPSLSVSKSHLQALAGPNFLSTVLIDYLLQHALKERITSDLLIGTSNTMTFFETMNQNQPTNQTDSRSIGRRRRKYITYSFNRYRFLAANCTNGHFIVIHVSFDLRQPNVFEKVYVYDSIRRTSRKKIFLNKCSPGAQLLRQFQLFLARYCADANGKLLKDPDFILQHAVQANCPLQENGYDCGLFAVGVLLHLAYGEEVLETTFTQQNISQFRLGLHSQLRGFASEIKVGRNALYCVEQKCLR